MDIHNVIVAAAVFAIPSIAAASGAAAFDKSMQPILESYLKIQDALASDKTTGVKEAARAIEKASKKLDAKSVTGEHAKHYEHMPMKLGQAAKRVALAGNINSAREALKELSKPMAMWGTMSKPKGVVVVFCSMAKGSWLQKTGDVRNPYFGSSMLACGEIVGGDDAGKKHGGMKHEDMKHGMHGVH